MNLRRLTPSMSLLMAFEAAARHQSFTRAADELLLTQSAVSRQVQMLEEMLGVKLFVREGRTIRLSDIGDAYAKEVAGALDRIRAATSRVVSFQSGYGSLHLAVLPTFGARWLMPRLRHFYHGHLGIMVHLHSRIGPISLDEAGMDAAINNSDGHWPGLLSHRLADARPVLIASRTLMKKTPIRKPEDILAHRLINVATRLQDWQTWCQAHNLPTSKMIVGPQYELSVHLIRAVLDDHGIALVPKVLVEEELSNEQIMMPLGDGFPGTRSYNLFYRPEKEAFPPLVAFRDWLLNSL